MQATSEAAPWERLPKVTGPAVLVDAGTSDDGAVYRLHATAREGDTLVLTKPIGTGILATAVKRGLADEALARRLVAVMRELNTAAAEAMEEVGAHACTDVTGFGPLGHLREMAAASRLDAEIEASGVPVLEPAREMATADVVPGGSLDNLEHVSPFVDWSKDLSRVGRIHVVD